MENQAGKASVGHPQHRGQTGSQPTTGGIASQDQAVSILHDKRSCHGPAVVESGREWVFGRKSIGWAINIDCATVRQAASIRVDRFGHPHAIPAAVEMQDCSARWVG